MADVIKGNGTQMQRDTSIIGITKHWLRSHRKGIEVQELLR